MTDTDESSTAALPQSFGRRVVEILLIVLVFFSLTGDPPPNVNEAHYLCRLKHFWNPQWCAGDLFLESQDTQVVFIWMFGWVTRWLSLAATAWLGRFVVWTLLACAWQRLSWRLVPRPFAAVLSAALFATFNEYLHLAGEWVVGGVEAKCFAYVFVLLALCDIVDRRWNRAWLLLGVATAVHPIVGGWSGVVCGGIWFWNDRRDVKLRTMLPGLIGGGLLSLPGVLPALMLTWNEPPELVAEANRIYVFDRLPHHLAPLTLPAAEVARRIGGHAALLILVVGLVVALRANDKSNSMKRIAQFALGAVLIAAIGFAIELALWNQPLVAARLLRYYWFRLTDLAVPMAAAICVTAFIAIGLQRRRAWAPWALAAALLATGWNIANSTRQRVLSPVPPADQKLRDFNAWVEACQWAAENTPQGARFLTPRLNVTFKWRAGRPEVANRKDLPQDARSIVEWHRRIKNIYYAVIEGVEEPLDSLGILGTERVRELAIEHGADYVLMDRGQLLSLPIVYRNEEYIVYHIDDGNTTNGR
ncbi:MAG: hypothetical protein L0228_14765 [Planctomycetes bacterium]|nr:hypothetical protein [Planctomycetota bacterium]